MKWDGLTVRLMVLSYYFDLFHFRNFLIIVI